jgi:DtxR family transcriptional regulator, manganese transport regulator
MSLTRIKSTYSNKERLDSIKQAHANQQTNSTVRMEDYLEVISELVELKGYATMRAIATFMNVKPPSVTKMLNRLADKTYIEYTRYTGVTLTQKGIDISNLIRQRHSDLLEFFKLLGVEDSIANQNAEAAEHYLDPKTVKQLRKLTSFLKSNESFIKSFH